MLFVSLAWLSGTAAAETPVTLDVVMVDFWPEMDQPGVTVFYEIRLADDIPLPQNLKIKIPTNVDLLSFKNEDGKPLVWEVATRGQWQELKFTTTTAIFYLSFNDPGVVKQDNLRSYSFEWLSVYPVNELSFTLQVPYGAGKLISEPQMSRAETCSNNCSYFALNTGDVAADEPFPISFQYEKDLTNPNYAAQSVHGAEKIDDFTKGRTASPLSVVIWLAAVALAMTILVGLYYWWFRRRSVEHQTHPVRGVGIENPEKQAIFCHECGNRSRAGDTFCRNCGTELRRFN
jgi:hypothetical protein